MKFMNTTRTFSGIPSNQFLTLLKPHLPVVSGLKRGFTPMIDKNRIDPTLFLSQNQRHDCVTRFKTTKILTAMQQAYAKAIV